MENQTPFQNNLIDFSSLPKFEATQKQSIEKGFAKVVHFNYLVIEFILIVAFLIFNLFSDSESNTYDLIFLGVFIFIIGLHTYNIFQLKTRKYAFREHDVIYSSGIISLTNTVIPYNKLQHLAVQQGWLSRALNLARLEFYTAGGDASDLKIAGMKEEEAFRYREYVVKLISDKSKKLQDVIPIEEDKFVDEVPLEKPNEADLTNGH